MLKLLKVLIILLTAVIPSEIKAKGKRPRIQVVQDFEPEETAFLLTAESNDYYTIDYLNTTLEYSTKEGWDIGISSQNIPISNGSYAQNYNDDTYLTISKTWEQGWGEITLGTMNGFQLYRYTQQDINNGINTPNQLHSFTYGDVLWRASELVRLHSGTYYVNAALSTKTAYVAPIFGIVLGNEEFYMEADYFAGHTNVSGAQVTLYHNPYENLKYYAGIMIPERDSGNEFAAVLGVQFIYGKIE